jgi:hypothetical protein
MPGPLLTVAAQITCPHGGKVMILPPAGKVFAGTQPVATMAHQYVITGCLFPWGGPPHPCVRVQWEPPAVNVLVGGVPAVLATSPGICMAGDGTPQGPAVVFPAQVAVVGT